MEKYCPKTMELSSTDEIAKAMWQEVHEGRGGPHGGVYLDLRHIPHDRLKKAVPGRLEFIDKLGYKTEKEMVEVFPVIHTTTGGIRIDPKCQTRVHGLFAAGQVTFAIGDNLGEGATGYTDALIWGKRAGEFAAKYSRATKLKNPDPNQVKEAVHRVKAPLEAVSGVPPVKLMRRLQHAMWTGVGLLKEERGLRNALHEIEEIRQLMLRKMSTSIKSGAFNHEMREAIELRQMLTVSEMIIRSSLLRKESRNRFHRSDYPNQDDKHWLRHIITEKGSRGMRFITVPVKFPYLRPEAAAQ
jgi:fumarate reductase (CoM/CoB) subunit A